MLTRIQREPRSLMHQGRCDIEHASHDLKDGLSSIGEVTAAGWAPAVDIKYEDGPYVLQADLPGIDPKDIQLHMEDGVLTLKGQRRSEPTQNKENYRESSASPAAFTANSRYLIWPTRRTALPTR